MLSKAHLTSHYRMSGSRWVITPSWLFGSWRSFLYSSSVYSCHLSLLSSASVRSIQFLSFIEPTFAWNVPLVSLIFLKRSLIFPRIWVFSSELTFCIRWQSIGASAAVSILPMNFYAWYTLGLFGLISLLSEGLSGVFSNTTVQKHQFFGHNIYGQCFFHSVILLPLVAMDDWLFMVSPLIVSRKTQYSPCKSFVLLKFGGWYTKWNSACIQMLISFPFSFAFRFSSLHSYL